MRALIPVTTAVFALTSVVHGGIFGIFGSKPFDMKDARIHLVPYNTTDCSGAPQQPPHPMVNGWCMNFMEAPSMKPILWKGYRSDWIDEVNKLHTYCKLETFGQYHCKPDNRTIEFRDKATEAQPENLNKCLVPDRERYEDVNGTDTRFNNDDDYARAHAIRSAHFVCGPIENPEHFWVKTLMHTSWSIEPTYGSPVPDVQKVTFTATLSVPTHNKATAQTSKPRQSSVGILTSKPDQKSTVDAQTSRPDRNSKVAARGVAMEGSEAGGESKGVWMLHPWGLSMMCYSCYTKHAHDYRNIECRGGEQFPIDCGPKPTAKVDGNPVRHSTTTSTVTAVTTAHYTRTKKTIKYKDTTTTITGVLLGDDSSDEELPEPEVKLLQKRSWHTPVKFPHPFIPGKEACADAEWEKRGQGSKQHVKLQHVHICGDMDRQDSRWLGFPSTVVHTSTATKTIGLTITHISTSTSTAVIGTTTAMIVQHDQL